MQIRHRHRLDRGRHRLWNTDTETNAEAHTEAHAEAHAEADTASNRYADADPATHPEADACANGDEQPQRNADDSTEHVRSDVFITTL
jgi:hypothetical protein